MRLRIKFPESFIRSKSIRENKARMVAAHRNEEWELARLLSQEKQTFKKRQLPRCEVCGVTLSCGGRLQRFCKMHCIMMLHRKRAVASMAFAMALAWLVVGCAGSNSPMGSMAAMKAAAVVLPRPQVVELMWYNEPAQDSATNPTVSTSVLFTSTDLKKGWTSLASMPFRYGTNTYFYTNTSGDLQRFFWLVL